MLDGSHYRTVEYIELLEREQTRPSVLFRPTITKDGNAWIALLGDNLQVGVSGAGYSPEEAMLDFDLHWYKKEETK
jgi:hypothetical protein